MGRPPKGDGTRTRTIQVRLTPAEHRRLKALARERGVTMADLLMREFREGN